MSDVWGTVYQMERDKATGDDPESCRRLRAALMRLANEVRATMSLAEPAVREAAGNTNYQCLMDAESEARVALGAQTDVRQS